MKLTEKQKRFADYYIETANGTESYRKAGYKFSSDNIAWVESSKLLRNPKVKEYIDKRIESKDEARIASQDEVLSYLTSVLRGEEEEENAMLVSEGQGVQTIEKVRTKVKPKDRLKAAEMLAKRYGIDKPEEADEMEGVKIEW